jgi:murein DD-endopeptidase MepM/ murein hydrolase activator NlpD
MRSVVLFCSGFIAGMLFLIVMLWSHGSLQPVRASAASAPASIPASIPATAPDALPAVKAATRRSPLPPPAPPPAALPQQALIGEVPPLIVPVQGAKAAKILDTFEQGRRGDNRHEATDIMAARGTPVLAAADGTVAKLFNSRLGGITIYQFDPTRSWCYYYAHLDHYAPGLSEGMAVRQGQLVGYVGSTGDASPTAPHLHFAIFRLGPEKQWWKGTAVNPYPVLMRHARQ